MRSHVPHHLSIHIHTLLNAEISSIWDKEFALKSSHSKAAHTDNPSNLRILLKDKSSLFRFTSVSSPVIDMIYIHTYVHTHVHAMQKIIEKKSILISSYFERSFTHTHTHTASLFIQYLVARERQVHECHTWFQTSNVSYPWDQTN
jgi:hypothetical protein